MKAILLFILLFIDICQVAAHFFIIEAIPYYKLIFNLKAYIFKLFYLFAKRQASATANIISMKPVLVLEFFNQVMGRITGINNIFNDKYIAAFYVNY